MEARKKKVLAWWMNQNDFFLTLMTTWYCFYMAWFYVWKFNDGGLALYTCLSSYVETVEYA